MTQRQEIIERLKAVDLGGGSHESLSAIAKAIYEPVGGWTIGACEQLRQTLVRLLGEADTQPSGESITDELREWFKDRFFMANGWQEIHDIADRIDAEHERALSQAYMDVSDSEWVRLPKDADGEVIHAGDKLDGYGKTIEVVELRYGRSGWVLISRDGNAYADTYAFTHHHAPTVEDLLTEFAAKLIERGELTNGGATTIAEFAPRLRLAGDAE